MKIKDREMLLYCVRKSGATQRELATVMGWRIHSYLGRLLRGESKTLEAEPAMRMLCFFYKRIPEKRERLFSDLFDVEVSIPTDLSVQDARGVA